MTASAEPDVPEAVRRRADLIAGSLTVRPMKSGVPIWYGTWRDSERSSTLPRLGVAWLQRLPAERNPFLAESVGREPDNRRQQSWRLRWEKRKGRKAPGTMDEKDAAVELRAKILAREIEIEEARTRRSTSEEAASLADCARAWLDHRERVKGLRKSTLAEYRSTLRAHVLDAPEFSKPLSEISTSDVIEWRDRLDRRRVERDGVEVRVLSRRSVNRIRVVLHGVFAFATRPIEQGGFGLVQNPVDWAEPLGEGDTVVREPLTPSEVATVAAVLAAGRHRKARRNAVGPRAAGRRTQVREPTKAERVEMRRQDEQDAAAVLVLAFCGLRIGELAALRWKHVELTDSRMRVERSWSPRTNEETATKSGEARWTIVPEQVVTPLAKLSTRAHFTSSNDLVFCGSTGGRFDLRAFRRRFTNAVKTAGIDRHLRLHDLRHGATTDLRSVFAADSVRQLVGHRDARTAQRYAHARDQADAASRWTAYLDDQISSPSPAT